MSEEPIPPPTGLASALASATRPPRGVLVELSCLLCGRPAGELEADDWPTRGPITYRATRDAVPPRVDGCLLRCGACGGTVHADEWTPQRRAVLEPFDWAAERPRRGRPPKRLAAARSRLSA